MPTPKRPCGCSNREICSYLRSPSLRSWPKRVETTLPLALVPQDLITDQETLEALVDEVCEADRYAIDTEFHRERTYYPHVALVQLAWEGGLALIDPLEVDLGPLARLLDGPGLCIMHAGTQDLEVLDLACGTVPAHLFDTQIAAGFAGVSTGSLMTLLDTFLNVTIAKGDRLTDWLHRPLTDEQLTYAAGDVLYLLELTDTLCADLESTGRLQWAEQESALLRDRPRIRRSPEDAVKRIKEARSLKGRTHRIATEVAAWRERRAANLDIPIRQVLPDIAVVAVAQQTPSDVDGLRKIRGLDSRHLRKGADQEILMAIQVGKKSTKREPAAPRTPELSRELRPVVTLVTSWISQLARDQRLDPALVATRADVEALLRKDASRLNEGWRAELVGGPIQALVSGHASLAFDGSGHLVLESRSGELWRPEDTEPEALEEI